MAGRLIGGSVGVVAIAALALVASQSSGAETARSACGTKRLYGVSYRVVVRGESLRCSEVRKIVAGKCKDGRVWSCFSFHAPAPVLVWYPSDERWEEDWSTAIGAIRYGCDEAGFTPANWSRDPGRFPTRQQVLADDLLRCRRLLKGKTLDEVRALLGHAYSRSTAQGRTYLDYDIGLARDSFIQLDDEFLSIEFSHRGVFRSASIYQG